MKNVIFVKAPGIKSRREMSMCHKWWCLARQRSGLLVIFLILLGLTLYKELFEGRGEEQAPAVTENKEVRRIFEREVRKDFDGKTGKLSTEVKTVKAEVSEVKVSKAEESEVEEDEAEEKVGKTQPRCHFRAPTENR